MAAIENDLSFELNIIFPGLHRYLCFVDDVGNDDFVGVLYFVNIFASSSLVLDPGNNANVDEKTDVKNSDSNNGWG